MFSPAMAIAAGMQGVSVGPAACERVWKVCCHEWCILPFTGRSTSPHQRLLETLSVRISTLPQAHLPDLPCECRGWSGGGATEGKV
jgi:hypothetical protein